MTGVSQEQEQQVPTDKNNNSQGGHDIYTDPAIANARLDDPMFQFFQTWWRHIAIVVAGCAVLIYFITAFQDTYVASMKGSADALTRLQQEYRTFLDIREQLSASEREMLASKEELSKLTTAKTDDKTKQEAEKKVTDSETKYNDAKSRLEEVQSSMLQIIGAASTIKEPYKSLAQLYRVLLARAAVGTEPNVKIDESIQAQFINWQSSTEADSEERFVKELGALALARGLLDIPEESEKANELLEGIARNGSYANVSAAITLSTIAQSKDELTRALAILKELQKKSPEQSDILSDEVKRVSALLN